MHVDNTYIYIYIVIFVINTVANPLGCMVSSTHKLLQDCSSQELAVMRFSVRCINKFFRKLRSFGVWIPASEKHFIAQCGQDFAEPRYPYSTSILFAIYFGPNVPSLCEST